MFRESAGFFRAFSLVPREPFWHISTEVPIQSVAPSCTSLSASCAEATTSNDAENRLSVSGNGECAKQHDHGKKNREMVVGEVLSRDFASFL